MLHIKAKALFGAVALAAMIIPTHAAACAADPYIGSVCFMANYARGGPCPQGYLPADGRILPVAQYQAVYAIIGNLFGGSKDQTFALPDLRGRNIIGAGQGPELPNVPVAQKGGAPTVPLVANNLPQHNHSATFAGGPISGINVSVAIPAVGNASANTDVPGNTVNLAKPNYEDPGTLSEVPVKAFSNATTNTTLQPFNATVSGTGALSGTVTVGANPTTNTPVSVLDPYLGLVACFAVTGLYPIAAE
ncbi:phage tail protein [Giesbergeria anulus]|uniref:Microcystin-dependent protein n=1 Tax=Giesbergeria anulus TaxID=180197 RepID=A0A1H9S1P4_9BURK|nr:tail fiber protein [Giesbergeria anulus]SER78976.1 Microcystin-dependent protein [Giesbergeria anulus]